MTASDEHFTSLGAVLGFKYFSFYFISLTPSFLSCLLVEYANNAT